MPDKLAQDSKVPRGSGESGVLQTHEPYLERSVRRRAEVSSDHSSRWSNDHSGRRVKRQGVEQKGAAGDGMTVEELPEHLKAHWPSIREKLEAGTYRPSPVRRVEILKPNGGVRLTGIPTVQDRIIQQAMHQTLSLEYEPRFSQHSYGFRPRRSAHDAVKAARGHIEAGYRWVVDIDLADARNHM